ncbi:neuropeptide-like precursor 1 isoform X2 [Lasioglossum baleicum]|uniref:neuropeptide-like precursor 1 isoform X2 n=1 Tax=Lasioglossum baleicum TaxID=434251 RepID=UPI003FCC4DF4
MSLTRSYLVTFLFYISIVNQIRLPLVKCQDEDSVQCLPKRALLALSRLPEIGFNLAAYSRTARVIQDAKTRNDMAHLKALTEEGDDDTEICIPAGIYSVLFKDPAMRGHFAAIGGTQKQPEISGRLMDDSEEIDTTGVLQPNYQKRSIAMLAKNDDLPISLQDRLEENQDDEEKRTMVSSDEPAVPSSSRILPRPVLDSEGFAPDYAIDKRNVGTLARDFALPPGRRNIASLVRDYELQGNENNDDYMVQFPGKRNVASLARDYTLPQNGKRNVGAVARDFGLPYGKRNLGSLARTGDFPTREHGKRSVSSLAKNRAWPISLKRGISVPASVILRTISRQGRSLADQLRARNDLSNIQELSSALSQRNNYDSDTFGDDKLNDSQAIDAFYERIDSANRRPNKQVSFSDEYPLPVMQSSNGFDYEEMMEALGDHYLNAEKRFMGSVAEMQPKVEQIGYPETFQASKRHLGSVARSGWLSSLRAARFSRSPRYLVSRENPADGPTSNTSSASSTRSLRIHLKPGVPHVQALHGDCRHGFRRLSL